MKKYWILFCLLALIGAKAQGQTSIDSIMEQRATVRPTLSNKMAKKFLLGLNFRNGWSRMAVSANGTDLPTYFYKPSLGGIISGEYYVHPALALSLGVGYQQRGPGIINPDLEGGVGNPDSTHRERQRFSCLDLQLGAVFRSPKEIIKGVRPSANVGLTLSRVFKANNIFYSVEDGFHTITPRGADYARSDQSLEVAGGVDINASNITIFRVQLFYNRGLQNMYQNTALFGAAEGRNQVFGIKLCWLIGID